MKQPSGPLALIVLDGWGLREEREDNAVAIARTPFFDRLQREYPYSRLRADGEAVGLMEGQMGNSNVGHLNLGAGRIVYQDLVRINRSIADGSFGQNEVLLDAWERAKKPGVTLQILGLVSDGGVHSHINHLYALVEEAHRAGISNIAIHAFLDGRDVPPSSAEKYLVQLQQRLDALGIGRVASVSGRYYAMDRDRRWERIEKAYRALTGHAEFTASTPLAALHAAYERGETDEFVQPTMIVSDEELRAPYFVKPDDVFIFFNFRADRARQLTEALTGEQFPHFEREVIAKHFITMTEYDRTYHLPALIAPQSLDSGLGAVIARQGWLQLRSAETEKYPHVTYFFNGGREEPYEGEDRLLVPSPKVATYDLKPEMSAPELTEQFCSKLKERPYRFAVLNFANPDMVGHTGVLSAAVQAVEAVDRGLEQVVTTLWELGGGALVLADHGNAECMRDPVTCEPHTAHTLNPVPCVLALPGWRHCRLDEGILADVAPTLLHILGVEPPSNMTGRNLIDCS